MNPSTQNTDNPPITRYPTATVSLLHGEKIAETFVQQGNDKL